MFIPTAFAENDVNPVIGPAEMTFEELYLLAISLIIVVAIIATVVFMLRGGLLVILSGGKEDKIKPAINTIRYSFFGLIIIVAVLFVFPIILRLFGFPEHLIPTPSVVYNEVTKLTKKLFPDSDGGSHYNGSSEIYEDSFIDHL